MKRRVRTKFDAEKALAILARMPDEGLAPAARAMGVAPSTARRWFEHDPTGELQEAYERCQAIRALMLQDEMETLIEAGARDTQRQIRWRQNFIDAWLPIYLQPGYEYRRTRYGETTDYKS